MKKPSSDIFDLIHSMSKNEKGYFKKYMARDGDNDQNYITLFDLIKKEKQHDETLLFKSFQRQTKKEISYRQFSRLKIYLYDTILKSLRMYHGEIKTVISLRNTLSDLSILYDKALYKQCNSILKGVKRDAISNEIFDIWLSALQMELVLVKHITDYEIQAKERKRILHEISEWEEIFKEYIGYYGFLYTMSNKIDLRPYIIHRNPKLALEIHDEIINHPLMVKNYHRKSQESELLHARLKQLATGLINPGKKALSNDIRETLKVYESNKFLLEKEPNDYAIMVHNYILNNMASAGIHTFKKDFKKFEIIERLPALTLNQNIGVLENTIRIKLLYYINNFSELNYFFDKEYESIRQSLLMYKNGFKVKNLLLVDFLLFGLCFVNEDFKAASYWLKEIEENDSPGFREDLKNLAKVYMLAVDYERNNFELLESHLRSFSRKIKNHKLEIPKEVSCALDFFKKLGQNSFMINEKNSVHKTLQALLGEMLKAEKLGHMKFLYIWLESRLSDKKMLVVAKTLRPAFF